MKKNSYQGQAYFNQQHTYQNSNQLTPDSLYSPYMQANSNYYPDQDAFYQRPNYQYQYYQTAYFEQPNYNQHYAQPNTYYNPTGTYYTPMEAYYNPTEMYYISQNNVPYANMTYNNTLYGTAPTQYITSPHRNEEYQCNQAPQQWNAYSPESVQAPYQCNTLTMPNYSFTEEPNQPLEENSTHAQESTRTIVESPHFTHEEIFNSDQEEITNYTNEEIPNSSQEEIPNYTNEEITNYTNEEIANSSQEEITNSNPEEITNSNPEEIPDYTNEEIANSSQEEIPNFFDLHQLEHSIQQSMQPIFDDAHSSTTLTDITDTLNEFESDLVKEVMAAMEEASTSKSSLIIPKKTLDSPSTSVFQATYVPGEFLGYSSTAAHTITPTHSSTITAPSPSKPDHKIESKADNKIESKIESTLSDEEDERIEDISVMTFPQWLHTICILLFPLINILALCSWACGKGNVNRVNFSRAMLVIIAVLSIFTIVLLVVFSGFY